MEKAEVFGRITFGKQAAKINEANQRRVGLEKYIWRALRDHVTRPDHRELSDRVFSWDDPPIIDKSSGRKGHPGDDYNCGCFAAPYVD